MSPRRLRVALVALVTVLLLSLAPAGARADAPPRPGTRSLGIAQAPYSHLAALGAAPPSTEHPWGTVLIAWSEQDDDGSRVRLGEWSLHGARWLQRAVIRHEDSSLITVRLAWSGERLVVVIGTEPGATTELIVMERKARADGAGAGLGFSEIYKVRFENAVAPSLDVDARFIALATYEQVTPVDPVTPSMRVPPAHLALHARLFDVKTLEIVGARMFRGEHLLRRHDVPEYAGYAIRLLAGRLYLAVADVEPRIVAARLPSLATDFERTFPVPVERRSVSSSSIVLNRLGDNLLIGIDATYVLSPKLENVAKHAAPITFPIATDGPSRRALSLDGANAALLGWRVTVASSPFEQGMPSLLFAHGRGMVFGEQPGSIRLLR